MKTRSIAILSAIVALGIGVQPAAEQNPPQTPLPWFNHLGTSVTLYGLVPLTEFAPGTTATTFMGGDNFICVFDPLTGRVSPSPLQVYSGTPAPLNFAVTHIMDRTVVWTVPGAESNNPPAVFGWGPPHSLLRTLDMIDGVAQFGGVVAAGDVIADRMPEVFYARAAGGSGEVYKLLPLSGTIHPFRPISIYVGGFRSIATGDLDRDGYDELAVSPQTSANVYFSTFGDSGVMTVGTATPFPGTTTGPSIDLIDLNNDGRVEALFGSPAGSPARVKIGSYAGRDSLDLVADFAIPGAGSAAVNVTGTVIDGKPAVIASWQKADEARTEMTLMIYEFQLQRFVEHRKSALPGNGPMSFEALFPPK